MTNNTRGRPAQPVLGNGTGPRPSRSTTPAAYQNCRLMRARLAGTRDRKRWLFAAAGTAAATIPAAPGLAYAAAGHPQAVPLLICSGVIGMASLIAGAAVKIHDSAQRTRRLQIQHAGPTAIAEAMARCIDDVHTSAPDIPASHRAAEAAAVRTISTQLVTEMMPAILAALKQKSPDHANL
jgi:hypothetical protein